MHETHKVLRGTTDALVLGFHLDESAAELELVCECRGTHLGADRAFVQFRFSGVRQFERKPGRHPVLRKLGSTFVARTVTGTWEIQAVRTEKVGALSLISISLGEAFGGIGFRYEGVTHEVVHLYGRPAGSDDWAYFELGTDRPVDFYNPFGRSWAEAG